MQKEVQEVNSADMIKLIGVAALSPSRKANETWQ
jgi:hypothetical protein